MAIATLTQLKKHMGIADSDTSQDDRLTVLLNGVQAWVKKASKDAGVILEEETINDVLDGPGSHRLFLSYRPVITFTALYHSEGVPRVFDNTTLVANTLYLVRPDLGILETPSAFYRHHVHHGIFLRGVQNHKAVYDAGYATIPDDLIAGVVMAAAAFAVGRPGKDGMQAERMGDYSYTRAKIMDTPAWDILSPYLVRPSAY